MHIHRTRRSNVLLACALLLLLGAGLWAAKYAPIPAAPDQASGKTAGLLYVAEPGDKAVGESKKLSSLEAYWQARTTYPTGKFSSKWLADAARYDKLNIRAGTPAGRVTYSRDSHSPLVLNPNGWTSIGPKPQESNTCQAPCFTFGRVAGRTNDIVVDPISPTVAYFASDGGGVWKTTDCCTALTTWTPMTDDPLISTVAIGDLTIDKLNHNNVYAGTGDLTFGSFSFGSAGLLKSTDAGQTWTIKGADVFGTYYPEPAGQFPQYNAIGKVEVDPRNSNNLVVGTKTGVYFSYDQGDNWSGPCLPDAFTTQRQDITGLLMSPGTGVTDLYVAVGTRGFSTTVQYNLAENGANGIYKSVVPAFGCPAAWTLSSRPNNGWPAGTGSGIPVYQTGGNPLGRIDLAMAPSNPNIIYAQVQSIIPGVAGGGVRGGQMGLWRSTDGGLTWQQRSNVQALLNGSCPSPLVSADYPQNWYDQGVAVDPNDPNTLYMDTFDIWKSTDGGTTFKDVTCGYSSLDVPAQVHVDQHALAYLPGSSSTLLVGSDGGTYVTLSANTQQPAFSQLNNTVSTIEFYSGDITANFANSAAPGANAGAQDNGSSVWQGDPSNANLLWEQRLGGDGMFARLEPVLGQNWYFENQNGGLNVSTGGPYGPLVSAKGGWAADRLSFVFPYEIYKNDCPPSGCTHMIAGSNRVWETLSGAIPASSWVAISGDLTKGTLADRSFINQLAYSVPLSTTAIVGTNDGNVQYGFGLGRGLPATWVNVTGGNAVLPNRPVLDVATDPVNPLVGYASVGGFNENTPSTPGHLFQVTCAANCAGFTWLNKSGNLPNVPADSVIANPNYRQQVFVGTDWGVYFTNDIDAVSPVWQKFNTGMPNTMIWDFAIDRGNTTLAAFTRSRGAFVWPLPSAPFSSTPSPTVTGTPPTATATSTPPATFTGTVTRTATNTATVTNTSTPLPCGVSQPVVETFESGTLGAFHATTTLGTYQWANDGTVANTGTHSAHGLDPDEQDDQQMTLNNPINIPANASAAQMRFSHRFSFEGVDYDGGVLEASVNGGSTWTDMGANITQGGYTGVITATGGNPLTGRPGYVGQSASYPAFIPVTVNLLPYAGQSLLVRFRIGSDLNTGAPGWWVDDVLISTTVPCSTSTTTVTPTATAGTPTATFTATATATACGDLSDYIVQRTTGTFVPGTTLVAGTQCSSCLVQMSLPFTYTLYNTTYSAVNLYTGGDMAFYCCNSQESNVCLPSAYPSLESAIFGHWDDLDMSTTFCGPNCGIYISTSGTQPNRIFNIEYRAILANLSGPVNFEIRLYENQHRFDIVYATVTGSGSGATVGVQRDSTHYTQFECNTGGLTGGTELIFTQPACLGSDVLVGHVTWQGRPSQPDPLQQLPITLTLKSAAGSEVDYPPVTTDASGYFTVSVSGVLPGPYTYRVKGPKFLANSGSTTIAPGRNTQEMGLMRAGDANNDNRVDVTDFSILRNSFGRAAGDTGYDDRADFNGDNRVNITDFGLLRQNFGTSGAPPVRPQGLNVKAPMITWDGVLNERTTV